MNDLKRLDAGDPVDAVVEAVRRDGAVIVRNLLSHAALDRFWSDVTPHFSSTELTHRDELLSGKTERLFGLVGRSRVISDVLTDSLLAPAAASFLGSWRETRHDDVVLSGTTAVQLSLTAALRILPGEEEQVLHRDDLPWDVVHPTTKEAGLFSLTAATRFTAENGGTRVIPGSHLWDDDRKPRQDEVIPVEMAAGSSLIYASSLYHAGGANRTNEPRTAVNINFIRGWLRQEENQYLSVPLATVRTLPRRVQELMGYAISKPYCGHIALIEPIEALELSA